MYTVHESVGFWVVRDSDGNTVATCTAEWKALGVARAMNGYPVLLEACRALVEAHDEEPSVLTAREWEAARAAIRKATGGDVTDADGPTPPTPGGVDSAANRGGRAMGRSTSRFDDVIGCWVVEDEQGDIWTAVTTGDRAMLVECEDSQRYYGAVWVGRAGGVGELHPRSTGDVEDGFDCNQRYEFSETGGWKMLDQQDEKGEGGDS